MNRWDGTAVTARRRSLSCANGQDTTPHLDQFLRRQLEADVYEELEIWGKFSPPPQFIDHEDKN